MNVFFFSLDYAYRNKELSTKENIKTTDNTFVKKEEKWQDKRNFTKVGPLKKHECVNALLTTYFPESICVKISTCFLWKRVVLSNYLSS